MNLRGYGVHFERIQSEQHLRYQMKGPQPSPKPLQKEEQEEPHYTWDTVSTWKYDNNVCLLYDDQGRLLDTLQLDLIIEEYVERVTESQKQHQLLRPKDDDDEGDRKRTRVTANDTSTGYRC